MAQAHGIGKLPVAFDMLGGFIGIEAGEKVIGFEERASGQAGDHRRSELLRKLDTPLQDLLLLLGRLVRAVRLP